MKKVEVLVYGMVWYGMVVGVARKPLQTDVGSNDDGLFVTRCDSESCSPLNRSADYPHKKKLMPATGCRSVSSFWYRPSACMPHPAINTQARSLIIIAGIVPRNARPRLLVLSRSVKGKKR
eukprot:scaffold2974_cov181-Amphora_coffeaeformis.AAC.4